MNIWKFLSFVLKQFNSKLTNTKLFFLYLWLDFEKEKLLLEPHIISNIWCSLMNALQHVFVYSIYGIHALHHHLNPWKMWTNEKYLDYWFIIIQRIRPKTLPIKFRTTSLDERTKQLGIYNRFDLQWKSIHSLLEIRLRRADLGSIMTNLHGQLRI